jgi:hypothetical protein
MERPCTPASIALMQFKLLKKQFEDAHARYKEKAPRLSFQQGELLRNQLLALMRQIERKASEVEKKADVEGFIDRKALVEKLNFDFVGRFDSHGFAHATRGREHYFVNAQEKVLGPFENINTPFSEGWAQISDKNGLLSYINTEGIVKSRYRKAEPLKFGMAIVASSFTSEFEIFFKDGTVTSDAFSSVERRGSSLVASRNSSYWIFANGKRLGPYDTVIGGDEGIFAVRNVREEFRFIDTAGKIAVPQTYQFAGPYRKGKAPIVDGKNRRYFINASGKRVSKFYNLIEDCASGYYVVQKSSTVHRLLDADAPWTYLSENLKEISTQYDRASEFEGDFGYAKRKDDRYLILKRGAELGPLQYAHPSPSPRFAWVKFDQEHYYHVISSSGDTVGISYGSDVSPHENVLISYGHFGYKVYIHERTPLGPFKHPPDVQYEEGTVTYEDNGKKFIINIDTNATYGPYVMVRPFNEGIAVCNKKGQDYLLNKDGTELGPYEHAWDFKEGLAQVIVAGKKMFVDKKGAIIFTAR